jgi:hypothetical protein
VHDDVNEVIVQDDDNIHLDFGDEFDLMMNWMRKKKYIFWLIYNVLS